MIIPTLVIFWTNQTRALVENMKLQKMRMIKIPITSPLIVGSCFPQRYGLSGAGRLQSALARDKLTGGPGLLRLFPEEGLRQGVDGAFDKRSSTSSMVNDPVDPMM